MVGQPVTDEPDRMWRKSIVLYFKILRCHLSHWTEQNDENPQSDEPVFGPKF
jgi:hypothetical protein